MAKTYAIQRCEQRVPMEVPVYVSSQMEKPGVETSFTDDVSSRGARVLTNRRWAVNDQLTLASLPGSFQSLARITYCQRLRRDSYAIGLQFLGPSGGWIIPAQSPVPIPPRE